MSMIEAAKAKIVQLKDKPKFEKMLQTAAILTGLFEKERLRPIIVGGLAVEIYTRNEYTTKSFPKTF